MSIKTPDLKLHDNGIQQLHIDGQPFLILGGNLGNSATSSVAHQKPVWSKLKDAHLNTILASVTRRGIEPQENNLYSRS
ncbi:hypothetical protein SEUCBS139899_003396 [Sporothrix eucalyptigena]|uniref:Uncharacterized protein n=1 Tax=Sporothrix eucalyptigena TaxID=1812306 RepID=A0ABP0C449_9PEZI